MSKPATSEPTTQRPLYSCANCREEYSRPAEEIRWCPSQNEWICDDCADGSYYDQPERTVCLSDFLDTELETLRAKVEELDKALTMACEERDEYFEKSEELERLGVFYRDDTAYHEPIVCICPHCKKWREATEDGQ